MLADTSGRVGQRDQDEAHGKRVSIPLAYGFRGRLSGNVLLTVSDKAVKKDCPRKPCALGTIFKAAVWRKATRTLFRQVSGLFTDRATA